MDNPYAVLSRVRLDKTETWAEFLARFVEYGLPPITVYKVITGRTTPNELTAYKLDRFMDAHREEIQRVSA